MSRGEGDDLGQFADPHRPLRIDGQCGRRAATIRCRHDRCVPAERRTSTHCQLPGCRSAGHRRFLARAAADAKSSPASAEQRCGQRARRVKRDTAERLPVTRAEVRAIAGHRSTMCARVLSKHCGVLAMPSRCSSSCKGRLRGTFQRSSRKGGAGDGIPVGVVANRIRLN